MIDDAEDNDEYGDEDFEEDDYYQPPPASNQPSIGTKISIPFFGGSSFQTQTQPVP